MLNGLMPGGFKHWRRTRPFWAGVLVILGGLQIANPVLAPVGIMTHLGAAASTGVGIGVVLILGGLFFWFAPAQRVFIGLICAFCSVISLVTTNLGGLIVGMLLGLVGSSMAVGWVPKGEPEATAYDWEPETGALPQMFVEGDEETPLVHPPVAGHGAPETNSGYGQQYGASQQYGTAVTEQVSYAPTAAVSAAPVAPAVAAAQVAPQVSEPVAPVADPAPVAEAQAPRRARREARDGLAERIQAELGSSVEVVTSAKDKAAEGASGTAPWIRSGGSAALGLVLALGAVSAAPRPAEAIPLTGSLTAAHADLLPEIPRLGGNDGGGGGLFQSPEEAAARKAAADARAAQDAQEEGFFEKFMADSKCGPGLQRVPAWWPGNLMIPGWMCPDGRATRAQDLAKTPAGGLFGLGGDDAEEGGQQGNVLDRIRGKLDGKEDDLPGTGLRDRLKDGLRLPTLPGTLPETVINGVRMIEPARLQAPVKTVKAGGPSDIAADSLVAEGMVIKGSGYIPTTNGTHKVLVMHASSAKLKNYKLVSRVFVVEMDVELFNVDIFMDSMSGRISLGALPDAIPAVPLRLNAQYIPAVLPVGIPVGQLSVNGLQGKQSLITADTVKFTSIRLTRR